MAANLKFLTALAALTWIGLGPMATNASAETVEVARKCDALTAKAYPPQVIGNPAAGSAYGTGLTEQAYYQKCVAKGGHIGAPAPKKKN
jgi:hypothetical protein